MAVDPMTATFALAQETVVSATSVVFNPFTIFQPHIALLIISIALTLVVVGLSRVMTNKKMVAEIKARTAELRASLAQAQKEGNKEGVNQLLNELMKANSQYMKHSFKLMIISVVVILLFIPWATHTYEGMAVATLPFSLPFVGSSLSWIYWYVLISFSVGWVVRKLFGLE